ncbi:hypothetical protein RD792_003584, partial [Penstemon davidsonii]
EGNFEESAGNSVLSYFVEVPHINQQRTWDCGLACVLMVLKALGVHNCDIQELGELCSTTSIWTVDLAYLLQKFSVSFTYCTVTLGANPDFSVETFYKVNILSHEHICIFRLAICIQEQLPNDLVRVNMLFKEAREAGIYIEGRSVSAKQISEFILSGKYVAIALVDQYKLRYGILTEKMFVSQSSIVAALATLADSFLAVGVVIWEICENLCLLYTDLDCFRAGHYVVICGYDTVTNEFEIRDPASSRY